MEADSVGATSRATPAAGGVVDSLEDEVVDAWSLERGMDSSEEEETSLVVKSGVGGMREVGSLRCSIERCS